MLNIAMPKGQDFGIRGSLMANFLPLVAGIGLLLSGCCKPFGEAEIFPLCGSVEGGEEIQVQSDVLWTNACKNIKVDFGGVEVEPVMDPSSSAVPQVMIITVPPYSSSMTTLPTSLPGLHQVPVEVKRNRSMGIFKTRLKFVYTYIEKPSIVSIEPDEVLPCRPRLVTIKADDAVLTADAHMEECPPGPMTIDLAGNHPGYSSDGDVVISGWVFSEKCKMFDVIFDNTFTHCTVSDTAECAFSITYPDPSRCDDHCPGAGTGLEVGPGPHIVAIGAIHGATATGEPDGFNDIAVGGPGTGMIYVLQGDGNGNFNLAFTDVLGAATPTALAIADFDSDGRMDLAVATALDEIRLYTQASAVGKLNLQGQYPTDSKNAVDLATADFNSDGYDDLVVANMDSRDILIFNGSDAADGIVLEVGKRFTLDALPGHEPTEIVAGDLLGFSEIDLVALSVSSTTSNESAFWTWRGETTTYGDPEYVELDMIPWGLTTGDLDGDGDLDCAFVNTDPTDGSVLIACHPDDNGKPMSLHSVRTPEAALKFIAPGGFAVGVAPPQLALFSEYDAASEGVYSLRFDTKAIVEAAEGSSNAPDDPVDVDNYESMRYLLSQCCGVYSMASGELNGDDLEDIVVGLTSGDNIVILKSSEDTGMPW